MALHIRLLVPDPSRPDVAALAAALRAGGHVVVHEEVAELPDGVAPAPDFVVVEGAAVPTPESLEASEARHIRATLHFTHGNRRQAALLLGIARSTLLAKLRKYAIST